MKLLCHKAGEKKLSRRQKVCLFISIVYFSAMLVLFVFSEQIQERALPVVQTCYVESAYINGRQYEAVVPDKCLLSDEEGLFIWVILLKDTPLGTRQYVKRQAAEIVARGEARCAIRPVLVINALVVMEAERELQSGEQVKISGGKKIEEP